MNTTNKYGYDNNGVLIPSGEGWEIVPEEEVRKWDGNYKVDIEGTCDGKSWIKYPYPSWPAIDMCNILAYRRRITKPATPLSDFDESYDRLIERSVGAMAIAEGEEGWEKLPIDCPMLQAVYDLRKQFDELQKPPSDWQPIRKDGELNLPKEKNHAVWVVSINGNVYLHDSGISSDIVNNITHWQYVVKPAPPIPPPVEKTVAERVWKAFLDEQSDFHASFDALKLAESVIQFTIDFMEKENKKV